MFLILTADQRFWKKDQPVLFLGEWCKLYNQEENWRNLQTETLPYHWDDREKIYSDYNYLNDLYEKILADLSRALNKIHQENHSIRYWRIIIGAWLFNFIQISFDRYQTIVTAQNSGKVTDCCILKKNSVRFNNNSYHDFGENKSKDLYNHYIYSRIIEQLKPFSFHYYQNQIAKKEKEIIIGSRLYRVIKKIIAFSQRFIPNFLNKIVIIDSYFNLKDLIKLQLSLGQIPYLWSPEVKLASANFNLTLREQLFIDNSTNAFEKILIHLIAEQMPLVYIENYRKMKQACLKKYPSKPKVIITGIGLFSNEPFKFWTAHQVDQGVKFLGTQHGGHYGTSLWCALDDHYYQTYDKFYTWGWQTKRGQNSQPLPAMQLNAVKKQAKPDPKGKILLVEMIIPRYSYYLYSGEMASTGFQDWLDKQYRFVEKLSPENKNLLAIRLYKNDFGWNIQNRWQDKFPTVESARQPKPMIEQMNESRLFVGTCNATAYLEALAANLPTILFWNPKKWEMNQEAQPYFDKLHQAGILYYTPEAAAQKVNQIADDPISWWQQPEVQAACEQFCQRFANTTDNWIKEWKQELKKYC